MYSYIPVVTKPLVGNLWVYGRFKNSHIVLYIYLNSFILELKEQVVFHSCSQKQQPASPARFNLE